MRASLIENGVPEADIATTTDAAEAVNTSLCLAQPGDLLVLAPGSGQRDETWRQVVGFNVRT